MELVLNCFIGWKTQWQEYMKMASLQQNTVLPLRWNWKMTLRPYVMLCLKSKGDNSDPAKSLLAFVSLKENTRPAFSERQWKWSTQAVTSARSLRMSPPTQTVCRKRLRFHLHFPPAAADPSWLAWASRSNHSQPRFPLLEPARRLPCSLSRCRHSYGLSCCTPSSPFQTLWLLPHWPKSLYNRPWSTLNRACGDSGTPCYAEANGWLWSMCYSSAASGI